MKKYVKIILLALAVILIAASLVLRIIENKKDNGFCGTFGPLIGGKPTCECDGEIVAVGGPSGPADDSGGYYKCIGKITSPAR